MFIVRKLKRHLLGRTEVWKMTEKEYINKHGLNIELRQFTDIDVFAANQNLKKDVFCGAVSSPNGCWYHSQVSRLCCC